MENVTDRLSNPFGMSYPCERPVPGYGDANAHFHVVETYTAQPPPDDIGALHATELRGGGFLVVPVAEPATWTDDEAERLVVRLRRFDGPITAGRPTSAGSWPARSRLRPVIRTPTPAA